VLDLHAGDRGRPELRGYPVEKTGFYTILLLVTGAIERGGATTPM
jgi:hypothetical protein